VRRAASALQRREIVGHYGPRPGYGLVPERPIEANRLRNATPTHGLGRLRFPVFPDFQSRVGKQAARYEAVWFVSALSDW
jgi:hypothetical protein